MWFRKKNIQKFCIKTSTKHSSVSSFALYEIKKTFGGSIRRTRWSRLRHDLSTGNCCCRILFRNEEVLFYFYKSIGMELNCRAIATGIAVAGSGVGTIIMPKLTNYLALCKIYIRFTICELTHYFSDRMAGYCIRLWWPHIHLCSVRSALSSTRGGRCSRCLRSDKI